MRSSGTSRIPSRDVTVSRSVSFYLVLHGAATVTLLSRTIFALTIDNGRGQKEASVVYASRSASCVLSLKVLAVTSWKRKGSVPVIHAPEISNRLKIPRTRSSSRVLADFLCDPCERSGLITHFVALRCHTFAHRSLDRSAHSCTLRATTNIIPRFTSPCYEQASACDLNNPLTLRRRELAAG